MKTSERHRLLVFVIFAELGNWVGWVGLCVLRFFATQTKSQSSCEKQAQFELNCIIQFCFNFNLIMQLLINSFNIINFIFI